MRTIETVLLLANLLTFFVLAVPRLRAVHWIRYSAPIALPIAIVQVLVEGPRWQMVPAYALSGLLFAAWLLRYVAPPGGPARQKRTNRLAAGLTIGLGVLELVVSIVLPIVLPVFQFPDPSGSYEVGTSTYHWVDADRPEVFTADPNDRRELMVQIWYPAEADASLPRAPWVQDADALAAALAQRYNLPAFAFGHLKYITSHAFPSAPVADDEPSYPVLIFLEGVTGFRQHNTFQVEELVSHGYVVVAIDQPYTAGYVDFPDGRRVAGLPFDELEPLIRQSDSPVERAPTLNGRAFEDGIVPYLAQDVSFTLSRLAALNQADPNGILTGRLDLQHAGILGVSLGGIVGAEACRLETSVQACLVMDAPMPTEVVQSGLQQPTMWLTRPAESMRLERRKSGGYPEADINQHQTTMRAVFKSLPGDGYFVRVPGMFHLNLTDISLLSPLASRLGLSGPIGAQRAHSIINAYSLAFFDRHLEGRLGALLDGPAEKYPEVLFETRQP